MYVWLKAFHIISMVTWFAGLFYLPRLFVYHAMCDDDAGRERFKIMERKLYRGIMAPAALLTIGFGSWLIVINGLSWLAASGWMHVKLTLVALLVLYHLYLGRLRRHFADDGNRHGHVFYRWLNEAPVLVLVAVVLLAEIKPAM
jgi:putative membrane protein